MYDNIYTSWLHSVLHLLAVDVFASRGPQASSLSRFLATISLSRSVIAWSVYHHTHAHNVDNAHFSRRARDGPQLGLSLLQPGLGLTLCLNSLSQLRFKSLSL